LNLDDVLATLLVLVLAWPRLVGEGGKGKGKDDKFDG
jgi:hypothetical protein